MIQGAPRYHRFGGPVPTVSRFGKARNRLIALMAYAVSVVASHPVPVGAQTAQLVGPPRNITDITAILDQQKPDQAKAARMRAEADAEMPRVKDDAALARLYFNRAETRALIGRTRDAIADAEKAIELTGNTPTEEDRYQAFLSNQYGAIGNYRRVIEINQELVRDFEKTNRRGAIFSPYLRIIGAYLNLGDLAQAEVYVKKSQALLKEVRSSRNFASHGTLWESSAEVGYADLLGRHGRYREAELSYHKSLVLLRDAIAKSASWPNKPLTGSLESRADSLMASEGWAKRAQGRLAEAEVDIRGALLSRLSIVGKFHPTSANISRLLANLLWSQSRLAEAEQMARAAVEIYRGLGFREDMGGFALALSDLAGVVAARGRWQEAASLYGNLDDAVKDWEPARRAQFQSQPNRIFADYYSGKVDDGIALARAMVAAKKQNVGEQHIDYALARLNLGAGLVLAQSDAEAMQLYRSALPIVLARTREQEDDTSVTTGFDRALPRVIEPYLSLLARSPDPSGSLAAEAFRLGDLVRGRSVQNALVATSARVATRDPALPDRVRRAQDLLKQITAEAASLNNDLALSPEERDDKAIAVQRSGIEKLRAEHANVKQEIERRFPKYASLADPKSPTLEEIRDTLRADEALLSFVFTSRSSFVWAVRRTGPIAFAEIAANGRNIGAKVKRLRAALEPNATTIAEIPPFDLALAYDLYAQLLRPVEAVWKPAQKLIVVTNGALGMLPLALLPTAPAHVDADRGARFAQYREVPWLIRTHAVSSVPSAAALRAVRQLPPGSPSREKLIAFGDPYFRQAEAEAEARAETETIVTADATRGVPLTLRQVRRSVDIDLGQLAELPRLPDTAAELRAIAAALQVDPKKALHLGKEANEKAVKSLDLSRYRIVAFATHGLVPGDLDGLTQPALALTAPGIAGVDGDGLLTMEEILALKLDADWVVLSACNTGVGDGAGAEAASGLGRAFFYAGTRALLVTNWSVHSASARALVSELFRRQAADPKLTRTEALRQASIALLDGPGFTDASGNTLFTYAHPLFWAPYTIIGDGG
jgi:CHAT domain-containing protein